MAQDLASLVIGLRADVAQLQSDLGKANQINARYAKEASETWTKAADKIGSSFGDSFKDIAGKLAAAFSVAGVAEFTRAALEAADTSEKLSQSLGASTKTIQTLSYAAGLTNTSLDSLTGAFAKLEKSASLAASGDAQTIEAFRAIGISANQAAELLKHPDELFKTVTQHIAQFADGGGKVPAVMQLLGRSAAEQIPVINKLGESFDDLQKHAEQVGVVLSEAETHSLAQAAESFDEIEQDAKGLANRFAIDLLPAIQKIASSFTEFIESDAVRNGVKALADNISALVDAAAGLPAELKSIDDAFREWQGHVDDSNVSLGSLLSNLQAFTHYQAGGGLTVTWNEPEWLKKLDTPTAGSELAKKFANAAKPPDVPTAAIDALKDILIGIASGFVQAIAGADDFGTHLKATGQAAADAGKKQIDYNANVAASKQATDKATAAADQLASMFTKDAEQIAKLRGGLDPLTKIQQDYVAALVAASGAYDKEIALAKLAGSSDDKLAQIKQNLADKTNAARAAEAQHTAELVKQGNVVGNYLAQVAQDQALVGMTERQKALTVALDDAIDKWNALTPEAQAYEVAIGNLDPTTEAGRNAIESATGALYDSKQAFAASEEAAKEWASIFASAASSAADAFAKALVDGGSFLKSLADIAKQVVEQIISYFAKLAIINPILNAVFGTAVGGGSLLPTLASAGTSLLGGGDNGFNMGGPSGATSAAGNAGLFGTAQGGYSLFQGGKNLWEGFQSGYQAFMNGSGQTLPFANYLGTSVYGPGMATSFAPSALGWGASIAGGVYAGYNRYQNSAGGAAGVAGGLTYGLGTTAVGLGVAGVATGAGFAAGVGALGALGPIGWAAIALMAVDMLSGGKLFGTKGKFNFGEQAITVGSGGATVTAGYDLKGQGALFSGSTHSWQTLVVDPAAQAAADAFFTQLKKGTEDFAASFGKTMGDIVGGQFIATFDKHGNVTGTTSTVAGHTYSGETQEQFQERLVAENELSVLGQFDDKLAGAIDKYRSNADELYAITNNLAAAQKGFNDGLTFLALGADQSTSALLALAEASQQMGETIDQTLQRIMQAQAQYDSFVAQFKPATNYVDDFEKALSDINATMLANIKQANDLARAAGAAGASEQDLANIHAYAAQQAAAALQALQNSAQSLAFDLGLTTTGSLEQVNSEIERLQAKANAGASAVHGFGSAMQDAADNAKHAMDLLLGDLSPLNDQQKLQKALEGLRAGTVTQEQVLEIGRRLYGSSQPYNALFAMVQQMGRTAQVGAGGGGIGAQGGGGLTGAERERLNQLLKEQAGLQAAATLTQYQTLAQQIAEIASAQGVDWRTVVQNMGINIKDFEAGLKLNDQQTNDFITAIQTQTDDNGENTQSLIEALDRNTAALDRVSGYQSGSPGDVETMGGDGRSGIVAPRGHGRGRVLTPEDADMIGRSVAQHSRGMNGRSSRPPTAASTAR